ncbi:DUF3604 domain-containing protein [Tropicimonas marinistellae]|uniref:DUF3604 domain-containing protein n=1 Tax=Tropicimonas marinistellae TaxID=1739787 RepID=UPI00098F22EE|nr:DUF3604 domain-containing protein [Tropicimonas marinistellae]
MKRLSLFVAMIFGGMASAQDIPGTQPTAEQYSPYPKQSFPNQVFFGDTHLHTSYSADAGMVGNVLGPDDAFRFAKGETVTSSTGVEARLERSLDFLVVADHAENLGLAPLLAQKDPTLLSTAFGQQLDAALEADDPAGAWSIWSQSKAGGVDPLADHPEIYVNAWANITEAAEAHNEPGLFTALIGFEWTSNPGRNNLHRNVIFRGGKEGADNIVPFSNFDSFDPEDLWAWMEQAEETTGQRLLAIPHNGNLSNGLMFDEVRLSGEPFDVDYFTRRARWEPLYEVTQMKGDGETHPMLSPDDEFADFETWDKGQLGPEPKTPEMLPREYARMALRRGLGYEAETGVNPFKFGLVGSTDAHTSLSTTGENNFFGKVSAVEPTADPIRFREVVGGIGGDDIVAQYAWQTSASGLAAVWSRENTRESIWDALARKEVYATTGTRLRVRVFAGYGFGEADLPRADFAAYGYDNGVPMGADLPPASDGASPRFVVRALRDPDGANLDRIQIVKGWLRADGTTAEKVVDIACGGRNLLADGCDGPVGDTVDRQAATWTNDIGQAILAGFWEDPDFDPTQRAFYYVRVLEIPTPRWTTYDAKVFGVEIPEGAPISIQERAYTSPIWYTPKE